MATELMMQVKCDRCERLETRPVKEETKRIAEGSAVKQFSATLVSSDGKSRTIEIGDLCGPCENTIANHLAAIEKKVEKKSPDRKAKK